MTRRRAISAYAALFSGSAALRGQQLAGEAPGRMAPVSELVNTLEFEPMAQRKLDAATYHEIAGSDRKAFDRMTFVPRAMVNSSKLDLTRVLFGQSHYTPILVGPVSQLKRFHPEGELAMARGAAAAKTLMVATNRSSFPIDQIAAEAKSGLWYQVSPEKDHSAAVRSVQDAVKAGCKAVCLTLGPSKSIDWSAVDRMRQGVTVPFLVKGIMTSEEATAAVGKGVQGIIVSNYGGRSAMASIEALPGIADAVGGKIPILVDGSFRRGSDVMKGLALGADAVLLGRPPVWGLAAYGADGVRTLLELLQSEFARNMAQCGRPNLAAVDRSMVKIHKR